MSIPPTPKPNHAVPAPTGPREDLIAEPHRRLLVLVAICVALVTVLARAEL